MNDVADSLSAPQPTVAILGSCLTRDNFNSRFNPDHKQWFRVSVTANQMSLISLMAPPLDVEWQPTREMSEYDRWNVGQEFSKGFLADVVQAQPRYLVIDLFGDLHFGVVQVDGGTFVTDNRWKVHTTDWYVEAEAAGRLRHLTIFSDPEEYTALWQDAVRRLAEHLRVHCPDTTVVVNRGRNTDALWLPNRPRPVSLIRHRKLRKMDVALSNELWSQLDDFQIDEFGAEAIDLTDVDFGTYPGHPWGPLQVHLHPEYYRLFLGQLHRVHMAREGQSEPDRQRMEALDQAWRAQVTRDRDRFARVSERLAQQNSTVNKQRDQIARLQRDLDAARSRRITAPVRWGRRVKRLLTRT